MLKSSNTTTTSVNDYEKVHLAPTQKVFHSPTFPILPMNRNYVLIIIVDLIFHLN